VTFVHKHAVHIGEPRGYFAAICHSSRLTEADVLALEKQLVDR
jgi:hypothetical protein